MKHMNPKTPEDAERTRLQHEFIALYDRLLEYGTGMEQAVAEATGRCDAVRLEKFLTDNIDLLSEDAKQALLLSLRIKHMRKASDTSAS